VNIATPMFETVVEACVGSLISPILSHARQLIDELAHGRTCDLAR